MFEHNSYSLAGLGPKKCCCAFHIRGGVNAGAAPPSRGFRWRSSLIVNDVGCPTAVRTQENLSALSYQPSHSIAKYTTLFNPLPVHLIYSARRRFTKFVGFGRKNEQQERWDRDVFNSNVEHFWLQLKHTVTDDDVCELNEARFTLLPAEASSIATSVKWNPGRLDCFGSRTAECRQPT